MSAEPSGEQKASAVAAHDAAADLFLFGPNAYAELISLLFDIQERYGEGAVDDDELQEGTLRIASAINDWALAPLVALDPEGLTWSQKKAVFRLLISALQVLISAHGDQKPLAEVAEHWKPVMSREYRTEDD